MEVFPTVTKEVRAEQVALALPTNVMTSDLFSFRSLESKAAMKLSCVASYVLWSTVDQLSLRTFTPFLAGIQSSVLLRGTERMVRTSSAARLTC